MAFEGRHEVSDQGMLAFDAALKGLFGTGHQISYVVEPRINGMAVELVYERASLAVGYILADGHAVKNVTPNLKTILAVPLHLIPPRDGRSVPDFLRVRGSVYMETEDFEALNTERYLRHFPVYGSPRDAAEAFLKKPDPRVTAKIPLNIFCSEASELKGRSLETHMEVMTLIQEMGIRVNRPHLREFVNPGGVVAYCHELELNRSRFPYEIDGAVIRLNQLAIQRQQRLLSAGTGGSGYLCYPFKVRDIRPGRKG
jgi:DNA ligase (NAD+)